MKKRLIKIAIFSAALLSFSISCSDDFVEREFNQAIEQRPLTSADEVKAFVRGIYSSMRSSNYYGCDYLAYGEVRSDEMFSNLGAGYFTTVQNYQMLSNDAYATDTWNKIYETVAKANIVVNTDITGFAGAGAVDQAKYLQGQAYGLRAVAFFDLLKLYGQQFTGAGELGIVLPTKYDPKAMMPRATVAQTEAQIDADFTKALQLMESENAYDDPATKTDLSISGLKALMTRFYLYKKDYAKVRSLVDDIVNSEDYKIADAGSLKTTFSFQMNGAAGNSIFELAVGINSALATDSYGHIIGLNGYANTQLKEGVVDLYDDNDVRLNLLTEDEGDYFVTGKYTQDNGADNIKMIRYEEVLLAGVEAELNGGSATKALNYYRQIIAERLLPKQKVDGNGIPVVDEDGNPVMLTGSDQANAITSVTMADLKLERLKELLGEGQRQWDLLRWGDKSYKPSTVDAKLLAFPIPRAETNVSGTPIVANPGYDN
ncbi:RagB/SusD family nutrient uptake outer membrane protein [Daejeonia sp. YH14]|uniref:RagB/SusD family nutrient uptake outer membrane protein n=1 Tax=Daejeonia sp. YH14 TaxID=3439042 RepID=UPI003F494BA0